MIFVILVYVFASAFYFGYLFANSSWLQHRKYDGAKRRVDELFQDAEEDMEDAWDEWAA